jgi:hypothetical protein
MPGISAIQGGHHVVKFNEYYFSGMLLTQSLPVASLIATDKWKAFGPLPR